MHLDGVHQAACKVDREVAADWLSSGHPVAEHRTMM